jgi:hypothetical protein
VKERDSAGLLKSNMESGKQLVEIACLQVTYISCANANNIAHATHLMFPVLIIFTSETAASAMCSSEPLSTG